MKKTSFSLNLLKVYCFLICVLGLTSVEPARAGNIVLVGNGAGGGPIFVTSTMGNIDLGTRLRVGTFLDLSALNNAISNYLSGSSNYNDTLLALNSNFADLGTNVTNYGSASQTGTGVSSSQVVFNTTASLAINGATAATYNVFNGQIANVNYSSSIGPSKNLYIWTTFNNAIAIVRNADGTGNAAWTSPTSDLSGVTMNLSHLQSPAGGSVQTSEVLLGKVFDYSSGSDLIALAVPEPSAGALVALAGICLLRRKKRNQTSVNDV